MDESQTTPITIAYASADGGRVALGTGRIDRQGLIAVDAPAPGQADYVGRVIDELNARENVIVKEPPGEGADRFAVTKRRVERFESGFLAVLKAYAMRVYALDLTYDERAFGWEDEAATTDGNDAI